MQSDRDKEQTRTVGVGMAEDVAGVDLAQNVFNGHSGTNHVRRVVHRQNDAGHDLNVQTDAAKATEFPKDVQVTRGWIVVKVAMTGRKSVLVSRGMYSMLKPVKVVANSDVVSTPVTAPGSG